MKAGDIILYSGTGWASRLIRRFTRSPGEGRTRVTHVALALGDELVVEALWSGVVIRRRTGGRAYRPLNVSAEGIARIVAKGKSYAGRSYGYGKVALHALDGILGGIYLFRRFAAVDRWPICSWVVASAYAEEGLTFGVTTEAATPDDIADFVTTRKDLYEKVDDRSR